MATRGQSAWTASRTQPGRFSRVGGQVRTGRRFARKRAQSSRRFARTQSSGRAAYGRRQSQSGGAQGLVQRFGSALPVGGSSGKRRNQSGGSLSRVGGLLSTLGSKQRKGTGRGGKPAMLALLGAGAAGAAVFAKRRKGSRSSDARPVEDSDLSQTPTPAPDPPAPGGLTAGEQPG